MPDQEFLASYAVDIDEDGVSRLQSILESNRSLAEALSSAFRRAYGDLSDFARGATAALPSLSSFIDAQSRAASTASQASQTIQSLTASYAGLRSAIPDRPLELSFSGLPSSGDNGSSSSFSGWLSDISGSLSRLVALSGGSDAATGDGSGRSSSGSSSPLSGETELSLNLAGASESLQQFMESLASSEAEIPASLNLTAAEESLAALQVETAASEAVLPLRLDRTRAEATYTDLRRILQSPVSLSADTSRLLSAASAALASIRSSFSGTKLQLNAEINLTGGGKGSGENGSDGNGTDTGGTGSGTDGGGNTGSNSGSDGPLVRAVRSATGGRFTRPTHVEVAEDGDTEYIIPVDKEPTAVPLLRQALTDMSPSARDAVLGDDPLSGRRDVPSDLSLPSGNERIGNNPLSGREVLPPEPSLPTGEADAGDTLLSDREAALDLLSRPGRESAPDDLFLSAGEPLPDIHPMSVREAAPMVPPQTRGEVRKKDLSQVSGDSEPGNIPQPVRESFFTPISLPDRLLPENILPSDAPQPVPSDQAESDPHGSPSPVTSFPETSLPELFFRTLPAPSRQIPQAMPSEHWEESQGSEKDADPGSSSAVSEPAPTSRDINLSDLALPELTLPELSFQHPEEPEGETQLLQMPFSRFSSDLDLSANPLSVPSIPFPPSSSSAQPAGEDASLVSSSPDLSSQLLQPIASVLAPAPDPFSALTDLRFPDIHLPDLSSLLERLSTFSSTALDSLRSLPDLLSSAAAAAAPASLTRNETKSVEAPVSINVTASGTDAELLAQSIYNAAQRHLVRTLRGAM